MRRLLGGLALVTLITAAAIGDVGRAAASDVEVTRAPAASPVIRLAPVVVSQVERTPGDSVALVAVAPLRSAARHARHTVDRTVCIAAAQSDDSSRVADSLRTSLLPSRSLTAVPRRYESSIAPEHRVPTARLRRPPHTTLDGSLTYRSGDRSS
jgi:hypothetical protein